MADILVVQELRRLVDESSQDNYTDETLSLRIDAAGGDIYAVAGSVWREKAARYAGMIDIQEGNSNRKMSQLHTQALKMADSFSSSSGSGSPDNFRAARTRRIERQ